MNLFMKGLIKLHSGGMSNFKIECNALTKKDLETLASLIANKLIKFSVVIGIPRGGIALADALQKYRTVYDGPILLVDDVLTTGKSMETRKQAIKRTPLFEGKKVVGVVIFARGKCPDWITPIFQMWEN